MGKVLVVSKTKGTMYLKQDEHLAQQRQLLFSKGRMEILPSRPLYTLKVNEKNAEIHMPRNMVIGQSKSPLSTMLGPESARQQLLVDNRRKRSAVSTVCGSLCIQPLEETIQDVTVNGD